jgi:four helix bundle protein
MFDFQKLNVYTKARDFNQELHKVIDGHDLEAHSSDQLSDSAYRIMLDIARGTAPRSLKERSVCFTEARASVHECAAILDFLLNTHQFEQGIYDQLVEPLDALSKMLYVLARKTSEMPEKSEKKAEPVES